ncbi:uncharacterized protein LOC111720633 [Sarcophilus harrisii]|uniref:uncharacterized protein LOC111720633 n=1 Tax=Sarcophilus harrisii TaxID=9305 RepID=UPI000C7C2464|nr:uncharacterized protein LOC111720633 [Sarcophilus harrisii]
MTSISGSASSMEIILAEETRALVAKMGGFVYFLNRMESEMIKMAKAHFNLILWMLRVLKRCQKKVIELRDVTENLKDLTKVFFYKKCAMRKEIENCQNQMKIKITLVRRSKILAQEVGELVKKAAREAAFRNSQTAAQGPKDAKTKEASELEYISLSLAENWWTLLEKCVELAEARISSAKKSLEMIEKREKWEKLLKRLFLQAAMAAQLGMILQKRRIEGKNVEIEKMVSIHRKHQKEIVCCKALEECEVMDFLLTELRQISEVIISELSSQEKVED